MLAHRKEILWAHRFGNWLQLNRICICRTRRTFKYSCAVWVCLRWTVMLASSLGLRWGFWSMFPPSSAPREACFPPPLFLTQTPDNDAKSDDFSLTPVDFSLLWPSMHLFFHSLIQQVLVEFIVLLWSSPSNSDSFWNYFNLKKQIIKQTALVS